MGIDITQKPEQNVVNVGDELTQDQINAINAGSAPATGNPFVTQTVLNSAIGSINLSPYLTRTNTFNTADAAVRITQDGNGEAFRVEDVTGDTSPFVIAADGRVGIGRSPTAGYSLDVAGNFVAAASTVSLIVAGSSAIINSSSSSDAFRITHTGTGNSFVVEDETNPDSSPFVIDALGNIGIGRQPTSRKLEVQGSIGFNGSLVADTNLSGSADSFVFNAVNTTNTGNAFVIENRGQGYSFIVRDEASDTSPFAISGNGEVGMGTAPVSGRRLTVFGQTDMYAQDSGTILKVANNSTGISAEFTNTTNATSDCVRITNLGTGNSFIVEDSTNPDASPFVINAEGNIGIGRSPTSRKVEMSGSLAVTGVCLFENNTGGTANSFEFLNSSTSNSGIAFLIENRGSGNSFVVRDEASDTTPFIIAANGDVTLGGSLTLAAGAYSANTAQASVTPDYPHELEFKVGGVTYRVPARAI